jgi:hypothetical protein
MLRGTISYFLLPTWAALFVKNIGSKEKGPENLELLLAD